MKPLRAAALCAVLCAVTLGSPVRGMAPQIIGFEDGTAGFTAISVRGNEFLPEDQGGLRSAKPPGGAPEGELAMQYSYRMAKGRVPLLVRPGALPDGVGGMELTVRPDISRMLMLIIRAGGVDHRIQFLAPGGAWTKLAANFTDFTRPAGSPPLQPEKVEAVSLVDIEAYLVNSPEGELAVAAPEGGEQRELWLDRLVLAEATPGDPAPARVGSHHGEAAAWLPLRLRPGGPPPMVHPAYPGITVTRVEGEPAGDSISFSYNRAAGELFVFQRDLGSYDLRGARKLNLRLRLSRPTLLLVQLKEEDGSEYSFPLIPGGMENRWRSLSLNLSENGDFGLNDESKDENHRLDIEQVREMVLIDAGQAAGAEPGLTTIDVAGIAFSSPVD